MRVAVTGASGLVGGALTAALRDGGHSVTPVGRRAEPNGVRWDPARGEIDARGLEEHDAVVHLAGESIAGLWTAGKKARIRESRVRGTTLLARTLAGLSRPPRALLSASAMGYYGDRPGEARVGEDAGPGRGFLAEVAQAWEGATRPAQDAGIRVAHFRLGNVLSTRGGVLGTLLPLLRLGLGARFADGRQPWPWVSILDVAPALLCLLEREDLSGPFNIASPEPATNAEYTAALGRALGRPVPFAVPAALLRLAPGGMSEALLLGGAAVFPRRLLEAGFVFRHPTLEPALRTLLDRGV